jgi:hypothetical protein
MYAELAGRWIVPLHAVEESCEDRDLLRLSGVAAC